MPKIKALHPKIVGKIYLEPNYAILVIKNKIMYKLICVAMVEA